jgi:hypothetical protein
VLLVVGYFFLDKALNDAKVLFKLYDIAADSSQPFNNVCQGWLKDISCFIDKLLFLSVGLLFEEGFALS